jgi:hypothetical protein
MVLIWVGVIVGFFLLANGVLLLFWPKGFVRFYDVWAGGDYVGRAHIRRDVKSWKYKILGLLFGAAGLYIIWDLGQLGLHGRG